MSCTSNAVPSKFELNGDPKPISLMLCVLVDALPLPPPPPALVLLRRRMDAASKLNDDPKLMRDEKRPELDMPVVGDLAPAAVDRAWLAAIAESARGKGGGRDDVCKAAGGEDELETFGEVGAAADDDGVCKVGVVGSVAAGVRTMASGKIFVVDMMMVSAARAS